MKIKKNHMIFLLVLIGIVCVTGGNTIEGMKQHNPQMIGGDPATWGPHLRTEHKKKIIGQDPATWGPHLHRRHHGKDHKETGNEQMMKIFFISFLLIFIVFLLL